MWSKSNPDELAQAFREALPDAACSLNYRNHYELIIAVALSAQTTDVNVNKVTPLLFKTYPSFKELSQAQIGDVIKIIGSLGLAPTKAKNIIKMAQEVEALGYLPETKEELVKLSGVGNKTASVYLMETRIGYALPVDTHVGRISRRMGLSEEMDPTKVEYDLEHYFNQKDWYNLHHELIAFGRTICNARKPLCNECPVNQYCKEYNMNKK